MGDRVKAFIIKMMILLALLLCLSGCGRDTIEIPKEIEGKEEVEAKNRKRLNRRKQTNKKRSFRQSEKFLLIFLSGQALFVRKWITSHLLWRSWRNLPENMS